MNNLAKFRKLKNLTQTALARKIGVSRSTISMWETAASEPDNTSLIHLAEVLEVSVDALLGRVDNVPKEQDEDGTVTMWGYGTGKVTVKLSKEELAVIEALIKAKKK